MLVAINNFFLDSSGLIKFLVVMGFLSIIIALLGIYYIRWYNKNKDS